MTAHVPDPDIPAHLQAIVRRALEQTVNGVVVSDATQPGNPIVYVNGGFTRLTGYPFAEVLGRSCNFLQGQEREQAGVRRLREAIARGEDAIVVVRNYRRDGSLFWNRVELSPVRDTVTGAVTHFFALQTDVTLEREAEEAAQVRAVGLERAIGAHPLGLIALDDQDRVQLFSPACTDLLGLAADEALGLDTAALTDRIAQDGNASTARLAWPTPPDKTLWELHAPQHRVIEVSASPLGALTGQRLVLLRDVTEQRAQQATRDHFLATAAHELRTPLGSIRGFTELLLMRRYSAEESRPLLETVLKQSLRLSGMLDDLLDLAQLDERGGEAFALSAVDLLPVVRQAADVIELPGQKHCLQLALPREPVRVLGHGARLEQVLINLLSNAVKYSPDGGTITCRVQAADADGLCRLSVSDQGLGLSEQDQARLFTRFFRANPGGPIPGTGLGLCIVKEMVDRMGGRIAVASRLGEGTTFTLFLQPAAAAAAAPATTEKAAP